MNPNDQPTGHSPQQPEVPQQPPAPNQQIPSLPTPAPEQPIAAGPPVSRAEPVQEEAEPSFYNPGNAPVQQAAPAPENTAQPPVPADITMQDDGREVVWTASEYAADEKSPAWYLAMIGGAMALALLVYFLTRDWLNVVYILVAAVIFGVAAGRQPRHMQYAVNDQGIAIGRRFYPYADFRSFSVATEGMAKFIVLMPLKRFMPPLSVYFDPADETRIGDVLADHLPAAPYQHELTERLMRRIRF